MTGATLTVHAFAVRCDAKAFLGAFVGFDLVTHRLYIQMIIGRFLDSILLIGIAENTQVPEFWEVLTSDLQCFVPSIAQERPLWPLNWPRKVTDHPKLPSLGTKRPSAPIHERDSTMALLAALNDFA